MTDFISDIAFTAMVKAQQVRRGSRETYAAQIAEHDWHAEITAELAAFIETRDSFYLATVSETGHPYIQHRGGPTGFLRVIDRKTLGFADFAGNRQYISLGNLDANDRIHVFLMDYANRQRVKLWGRAHVIEDDPELLKGLTPAGYQARPERAILIHVDAWDLNCPQHIPELHDAETIRRVTQKLTQRIAELEAEVRSLQAWLGKTDQ